MDAIPGLRPAAAVGQGSPRPASPRGGFAVPGGGAVPAGTTSEPVAMSVLLALQEAGGEAVGDREAKRRGRALLDELAALQRDLLAGPPDAERLARLAALAAGAPEAADPRLRGVLQAIVLRARVEAARYRSP